MRSPSWHAFERLGASWDALWYTSPRASWQEARAIQALLAHPREGSWVLDLGCGTGRHACRLARLGYRVLGVDRAPAMVAAARAKARAFRVARRARFVVGDALRLPVPSGAFDVALSLCEGAHGQVAGSDLSLFREAARALRPGGALVLVALSRPWLDRDGAWRYDPRSGRHGGRERHVLPGGRRAQLELSTRAYGVHDAARLLARAGFTVVDRRGAAPGAYGTIPLDDAAMQYLLVGLKVAKGAGAGRAKSRARARARARGGNE